MARAFVVFLAIIVVHLSATPCAGNAHETQEPPTLHIAEPLRQPLVGERLSFQGRWFGIPVGQGWIEVKGIVELDGHQVYHIEGQGFSNDVLSAFYPIRDVVHSYLDVETLRPLRFEKYQREGHYRADEIVTFDYLTMTATYRSLLNGSVKEIPLPPNMQDLISALYWFRAQLLHAEQSLMLDLYTDEKIFQTVIHVSPPFLLELLKRGTFPCVMVEPAASFKGLLVKRGRLWAYFTTDAYRIPLMIKATTPWGQMSAVIDEASLQKSLHPVENLPSP